MIYNEKKDGDSMLEDNILKQMIQKINKEILTDFIILFGSFAKGTIHNESDIDLAYFSNHQLSPYERFLLAGELANISGYEVDLIDIRQIDTIFTMQIFSEGKVIFMGDNNEYTRQQMRAYSMYVTLNEQRKPIIDSIKVRGSVFGILNKVTTIERCISQIHEVYKECPDNLKDFTKQDSIILNIQRTCEASVDLAMHIASEKK